MSTPPNDPYEVAPPFPPQPGTVPQPGPTVPQPAPAVPTPPVDLDKHPAEQAPGSPAAPAAPYTPYGAPAAPPYNPYAAPPVPPYAAPPVPYGGYGGQPSSPYPPAPMWPAGVPWQVPAARPRTSPATATMGWVLMGLGILIVVASALPWGSVHLASGQSCRVLGVRDGSCGPYTGDYNLGILTIALSVPVIVMGLLRGCLRRRGVALASAIVGLVLGCLISLFAAIGPTGPDGLPASADFTTGYGVWLTLAFGVLLIAASIWGIVKRR